MNNPNQTRYLEDLHEAIEQALERRCISRAELADIIECGWPTDCRNIIEDEDERDEALRYLRSAA